MNTIPSYLLRRTDADQERFRSIAPRSDVAIEEEIWSGILKDRDLGPRYQENIEVEVDDGRVTLRGYALKPWHNPLIVDIADRVEGVVLVKSELTTDSILQEQVVQALLKDEITSPYIFTVKSSFGWIRLGGLVPSREIARAAETAAGFVPAVRGILSLPSVIGATWLPLQEEEEPIRRTLQPRLAAWVYQDDEGQKPAEVGWVSQVVIDPVSRLVSAIAVSGKDPEKQERFEKLVPMSAVEAVNNRQVWLKEGERVENCPPFERSQFPYPPASWRPPFPYQPGMVRWIL